MSLALTSRRAALLPGRWVSNELWRRARAVPSLDLRFAENKSLVDSVSGQNLITFTRASTGTYVDSDGVIRSAATNLLLQSNAFTTTWSSNSVTLTAASATSPAGVADGWLFADTTSNSNHNIAQGIAWTAAATTFSIFAKYNTHRWLGVRIGNSGNQFFGSWDLQNGVVGSSTAGATLGIQNVGNGWYRLTMTATLTSAGTANLIVGLNNADATALTSYLGTGTSSYIYGAQLELGSTATPYIPTGATINSAPRFDHNPLTGECLGLLVEEQRQNLLLRSEEFDNASWISSGLLAFGSGSTANALAAPTGVVTADLLTESTDTSVHGTGQPVSLTAGISYAFSVYAKSSGRTVLQVMPSGFYIANAFANFDLANGVVGTTSANVAGAIQRLANDWYRCIVVFTATSTASGNLSLFMQQSASAARAATYTGDGTSGIYIWGAQLEAGAFPTSYIKTEATAATRTADVVSITTAGGNIRSLFTSFRSPASGTRPVVSLDDNTANERIEILTSGTDPKLLVTDGGSAVADLNGGTVTANVLARIAARFNTDDYAVSINGGTSQLDAAGALPTVNRIRIGSNQAGGYLSGSIARVTGWDSPLDSIRQLSQ